ncbi:MAG: hypothetical protein GF334_08445 [Candidatus Altiarchaeales archaeon]|nr:hypothetical protein [Candidatus Altiarchaeales archaeon]
MESYPLSSGSGHGSELVGNEDPKPTNGVVFSFFRGDFDSDGQFFRHSSRDESSRALGFRYREAISGDSNFAIC